MTKKDYDKLLSFMHGQRVKNQAKEILDKYVGIDFSEYEEVKLISKDGKLWKKK